MDRHKDGQEDAREDSADPKPERRKGTDPALPTAPKSTAQGPQPLSFNGDTACDLAPTAVQLWALPRGQGQAQVGGGG